MNGHGPHAHMFRQTVKGLRFGAPRSYEGLCVLPLLSATECHAEEHAAPVTEEVRSSTCVEPQEERAAHFCGAQIDELDDYVGALDFADDDSLAQAVGAVVFLEGRFVCVDLLRPAERFGRLYPKLLRGYALEALVSANKRDFFVKNGLDHLLPPDSQSCTDFDPESAALLLFAELMDAEFSVQSAVDLGEDIRLESKSVSGSGLAWNDELLQVSLLPRQAA